jgi:membrane protease YdiL (CAAX protease family)
MTSFLAHSLAAYAIVAGPWLSRLWVERVKKQIAAGVPNAKVSFYRSLVVEQITTTAWVLALWRGGISANSLGLVPPHSWSLNGLVLVIILTALVWSSLKLRPKAEKLRLRLKDSVNVLLPDTNRERPWFGAISVGAGISEEFVFRGFLLYYFTVYLPHLNTFEKALLTSLCFGLGHIYQGWKGAIGTGVLGLFLAGLYLLSGSLLLPVLVHAAIDYRALLIFPPQPSTRIAESNTQSA